jgi:hypothetical protein
MALLALGQRSTLVCHRGAWFHHICFSFTSPPEKLSSVTLWTLDDVGLSRAIPLTSIKEEMSMGLEAKQLEECATSNNMLLNGKMFVEIKICYF